MAENEIHHNGAPDRFIMCSGGMDSVATAHYMLEDEWDDEYSAWNKRPVVVFLDTTVGLSAQRIYVETLCDHYEWQLWTLRTHENFEGVTEEEGFHGNQQHDKIFNVLKGRQMGKLATTCGNPHFYFGSRRDESPNRSEIEKVRWDEGKRATVHNPIVDWKDEEVVEYLRENEIPFNPNWECSIPTDCACGATAAREELIELEAEGYEVFAQKLRDLEERVETGDKTETWAWGSFSPDEQKWMNAENDPEQTQLSDMMCGPNCSGKSKAFGADYPTATDGGMTEKERNFDGETDT